MDRKSISTPGTNVRLSGIEVYARIVTICEAIAMLEKAKAQSSDEAPATFRSIIESLCTHFEVDDMLAALMPHEGVFKTFIATRSGQSTGCFRDAHTRLLNAREVTLPWLLLQTYADHPPTAVEAYRFLKLGDIQKMLEKIASILSFAALYIDRNKDSYDTQKFIDNHTKQVEFLLDQLVQYGIEADNYSQAVQQYVAVLDSVFPAAVRTNAPSPNLVVTVSGIPA